MGHHSIAAEDTLSVWEVCDIVKDSGFSTLQSPTAAPKAGKAGRVSFDGATEEASVPWATPSDGDLKMGIYS